MKKKLTGTIIQVFIIAGLCLILLTGSSVQAKTIRLVIGGGTPRSPFEPDLAQNIKNRIEAETSHKVVVVKAFGSVAKNPEMLKAMRDGLMNIGLVSWAFFPNELYLHNFGFALPFSTPDSVQAYRIGVKMLEEFPQFNDILEKKYNQKLLCPLIFGGYGLVSTYPVKSLSDLKNKKIAGVGRNLSWIKDAGAVPVQAGIMEAYTSLQTGVYDGFVITTNLSRVFKLYEVAKYWTHFDLGDFIINSFTINLDYFNKLPKDVQKIVVDEGRKFGLTYATYVKNKAAKDIAAMEKAGVQLIDVRASEKMRWANSMQDYAKVFITEAERRGLPGEALLKAYTAALQKEGFKFPRQWVNP